MKRWSVVMAACLTLLLGVPLAWSLTRPAASSGLSLDQALPVPTPTVTATRSASGAAPSGAAGTVTARPADIPAVTEVATPSRMRIPSVGVDAAVDPVGVEDDGSMVIPRKAARVGWYRFGPAPGAPVGNAVIAGHVDSHVQGAGALFRLRDVAVGDVVEVDSGDGMRLRYRVTSMERIVKKALPTERLFARTGPPRLVLITCGGPFDRALRSYQDNLVVVAEPLP
jgi:hypothetical protein